MNLRTKMSETTADKQRFVIESVRHLKTSNMLLNVSSDVLLLLSGVSELVQSAIQTEEAKLRLRIRIMQEEYISNNYNTTHLFWKQKSFLVLSISHSVILLTIVNVLKIEGSCVDDAINTISLSINSNMKKFEGGI